MTGNGSMKRRELITLLGVTVAWPVLVRAQQSANLRRIGVLSGYAENDPEGSRRAAALLQGLQSLGWNEGRNIKIEYRWTAGDANRMRVYASELVNQNLDVLLTSSTPSLAALQKATRSIPIVFVAVSDPVGDGFVQSFARPGGNITGFSNHEPALAGKWMEILKELAPSITRVAALFNPDSAPHSVFMPLLKDAAPTFALELIPAPARNALEIEKAIAALGREGGGGLIVMPDISNAVHRGPIVDLAARHRVPAVYYRGYFAKIGGLVSFGPDDVDQHRRAAAYIDRILRGANPAELPVQAPSKFEFVLNARAAAALGLTVPQSILLRADEVVQ